MQTFVDSLRGIFKYNYPLKNLNWFKVGGEAEFFFSPSDLEDLIIFLKNRPKDIPLNILGVGSNVLIKDKGVKGFVVKLNNLNDVYFLENGNIFAQCGALNISVSNLALKGLNRKSKGGFEFLSGIPGSIGGAIAMNAGSFGREFADICVSVKALNLDGDIVEKSCEEMGFSYRKNSIDEPLIFISAVMLGINNDFDIVKSKIQAIKNAREETQPKKVLTGGSTFANPTHNNPEAYKAWQLIDMVGLRGYKVGNAGFSEKHCNFIINYGDSKSSDIENLIAEAKIRVKEKFNIDLHQEIKLIG